MLQPFPFLPHPPKILPFSLKKNLPTARYRLGSGFWMPNCRILRPRCQKKKTRNESVPSFLAIIYCLMMFAEEWAPCEARLIYAANNLNSFEAGCDILFLPRGSGSCLSHPFSLFSGTMLVYNLQDANRQENDWRTSWSVVKVIFVMARVCRKRRYCQPERRAGISWRCRTIQKKF